MLCDVNLTIICEWEDPAGCEKRKERREENAVGEALPTWLSHTVITGKVTNGLHDR